MTNILHEKCQLCTSRPSKYGAYFRWMRCSIWYWLAAPLVNAISKTVLFFYSNPDDLGPGFKPGTL